MRMLLPILEYPDPRLRKVAAPVTAFDPEIQQARARHGARPCTRRPASGSPPRRSTCTSAIIVIDISDTRTTSASSSIPRSSRPRARPSARKAACPSRGTTTRSPGPPGSGPGAGTSAANRIELDRGRPARRLHPARNGPSARQGLRRLPVAAEARAARRQARRRSSGSPADRRAALAAGPMASARLHTALRVGFAGTPPFAARALARHRSTPGSRYRVVLTQPDRPSGPRPRRRGVRRSRRWRSERGHPASRSRRRCKAVDAATPLLADRRSTCWSSPRMGSSCRSASSSGRATAASTSTRRCSRAGAAPRRSSARSRRATRDRRHDHADGRGPRHRADRRPASSRRSTPRETAGTLHARLMARGCRRDRRRAADGWSATGASPRDRSPRTARPMRRRSTPRRRAHRLDARATCHRPPGARVRSGAGRRRHARRRAVKVWRAGAARDVGAPARRCIAVARRCRSTSRAAQGALRDHASCSPRAAGA